MLHGARHMVAMQTASDPTVRQVLRRAFRERAILSVRPTKKGKKVPKRISVITHDHIANFSTLCYAKFHKASFECILV